MEAHKRMMVAVIPYLILKITYKLRTEKKLEFLVTKVKLKLLKFK